MASWLRVRSSSTKTPCLNSFGSKTFQEPYRRDHRVQLRVASHCVLSLGHFTIMNKLRCGIRLFAHGLHIYEREYMDGDKGCDDSSKDPGFQERPHARNFCIYLNSELHNIPESPF